MSEFKNVTIVKKANVYFDGKVTSRSILFADGSKKTLGIMLPGEYTFNTAGAELMEVLAGYVEVAIGDSTECKCYKDGEAFEVPAHSSFTITVKTVMDYCCSFLN
ncbi:MAG: pyrimidine/purine nucleoside phosphorylase [Geobacteraceae bacterium]